MAVKSQPNWPVDNLLNDGGREWQASCETLLAGRGGCRCQVAERHMKMIRKPGWLLIFALIAGTAAAQNTPAGGDPVLNDPAVAQPKPIREQGRKIGRPLPPRRSSDPLTAVSKPEVVQPTEVKNLIERFQAAREQYLLRQKQLVQQFRQATDEQRAELREQMKENLDQWRERQLEFRSQLKDRAVELRRELQGELRDVVSEGSKEGEGPRRRQ